ncbi:hypothetical protein A6M21_03990 [Desulfotomaculum copahuensis]|uniref:Uncharacterized protein n=1 Tax=Desulfotomaculum copahuensis TaxID=1838280 RepID=A0A1B7LI85_9FIRM|nr:hypothetical protein A6M21_03990 [Desulfotomaculum copahuensis]
MQPLALPGSEPFPGLNGSKNIYTEPNTPAGPPFTRAAGFKWGVFCVKMEPGMKTGNGWK